MAPVSRRRPVTERQRRELQRQMALLERNILRAPADQRQEDGLHNDYVKVTAVVRRHDDQIEWAGRKLAFRWFRR